MWTAPDESGLWRQDPPKARHADAHPLSTQNRKEMHIPYAGTAPASAGTVPCLRAGKSRPKLALLLIPIVPKIRLFRKVQLHRKMPNFLVDNYAICPSFHFFSGISVIFAGGNHRVFVGIDGKHGAFPGFGSGGQGRLPGCSFSAWPGYGCCFFHSAVAGVLFSAWLGLGCCFFYSAVAGVFFSAWLGFRCCFFYSAVAGVFSLPGWVLGVAFSIRRWQAFFFHH